MATRAQWGIKTAMRIGIAGVGMMTAAAANATVGDGPSISSNCPNVTWANPNLPASDPTLKDTLVVGITGEYGNAKVTSYCTAELLNDTSSDGDPLIVLADHCLPNNPATVPGDSLSLVTYWEVDTYNGLTSTYGYDPGQQTPVTKYAPHRTYNATVRAIYKDTALLDLNAPPPTGAQYAAWNAARPAAGDTLTNTNDSGIWQLQLATGTWRSDTYNSSMYGAQNQLDLVTGYPADGSSGSGWYDTGGALRAVESGGDVIYCTQDVTALADSFAGDGTPTGSLKFWLDPSSSGATSASGMTAPYNPTVPDGYAVPPPTPPPTTTPSANSSGGGAANPFVIVCIGLMAILRRKRR